MANATSCLLLGQCLSHIHAQRSRLELRPSHPTQGSDHRVQVLLIVTILMHLKAGNALKLRCE